MIFGATQTQAEDSDKTQTVTVTSAGLYETGLYENQSQI